MTAGIPRPVLQGKRALVVGIANEHSIAYGCARAFRELAADLALTYLNERARTYVEPLATVLGAPILAPLDVGRPGELLTDAARRAPVGELVDIMDVGLACPYLAVRAADHRRDDLRGWRREHHGVRPEAPGTAPGEQTTWRPAQQVEDDLMDISRDYDSDRVVARFAVVRRERMVAW